MAHSSHLPHALLEDLERKGSTHFPGATSRFLTYLEHAAADETSPDGFMLLDPDKLGPSEIDGLVIQGPEAFKVHDCGCIVVKYDVGVCTHTHWGTLVSGLIICSDMDGLGCHPNQLIEQGVSLE